MMKTKPAREKAGPDPVIREWASDMVWSNYWVKIGLTRGQSAALSALAKLWGFKRMPAASCARWIVMLGLDCLPILQKRADQLNRYIEDEDLSCYGAIGLLDGRARHLAAEFKAEFSRGSLKS
jgi:hypothetical protein